jgi:hypothetical protein
MTITSLFRRDVSDLASQYALNSMADCSTELPKEYRLQDSFAFTHSPHAGIAQLLFPLIPLLVAELLPLSSGGMLLQNIFISSMNFCAKSTVRLWVVMYNEGLLLT